MIGSNIFARLISDHSSLIILIKLKLITSNLVIEIQLNFCEISFVQIIHIEIKIYQ